MPIKPVINLATKCSENIVGMGVRKWVKPKSFEGLRFAPTLSIDSFSSTIRKAGEKLIPADSKLFSWAKKKPDLSLSKINPDSLVMVHRTSYFPKNGKIMSTGEVTKKITGVSEYRPTIHSSLNKSVTEHAVGADWNDMEYSIIFPFKEMISSRPKSTVIGGIHDDFFVMGSINLPRGSVVLKRTSGIPKESLKVSEIFDGIKLVETSADDMVNATNLIIKKMGYTPYHEALQKYLGASAEEMKLIMSVSEVEFLSTVEFLAKDLEANRTRLKSAMKSLEEFKDMCSKEAYNESMEAYVKNLKMCDIAEKYAEKIKNFKSWEKFLCSKGYYSGLHDGTAWAESEKLFVAINILSKGSKNSWVWNGTDYKNAVLAKLQDCKVKLPKNKDIGYDIDKVISIVKNSDTPEIAERQIRQQLKITGMRPIDRSKQFRKLGMDEQSIAELVHSIKEAPDEFMLDALL